MAYRFWSNICNWGGPLKFYREVTRLIELRNQGAPLPKEFSTDQAHGVLFDNVNGLFLPAKRRLGQILARDPRTEVTRSHIEGKNRRLFEIIEDVAQ